MTYIDLEQNGYTHQTVNHKPYRSHEATWSNDNLSDYFDIFTKLRGGGGRKMQEHRIFDLYI